MITRPLDASAGAGVAEIDLTGVLPLDRFDRVHDPLRVRVLVCSGSTNRIAIAVVDLTSIGKETLARIKTALADVTGAAAEQVVVIASHTFSAPHIIRAGTRDRDAGASEMFEHKVEAAAVAAASTALGAMRPVRWTSATGEVGVSVCRDVLTPDGWGLGADASSTSARPLVAIAAIDEGDDAVAVLFSTDVQPAVLDGVVDAQGNRAVSADLAGVAVDHVERELPGTVAFFLPGAAGDRSPVLVGNAPVRHMDGRWSRHSIGDGAGTLLGLLGRRLADAVVELLPTLSTMPGSTSVRMHRFTVDVPGQVALPREEVSPRAAYQYTATGVERLPVVLVRLGDLVIVGVQPELNAATGDLVRMQSPFKDTLVATMVDGAAKYLPDAISFDRITYEAMSSRYARGSAEKLAGSIAVELSRLHSDRTAN